MGFKVRVKLAGPKSQWRHIQY